VHVCQSVYTQSTPQVTRIKLTQTRSVYKYVQSKRRNEMANTVATTVGINMEQCRRSAEPGYKYRY